MPKPVFIRGQLAERPLRPAHLKAGRSLLRTVSGFALVTCVGVVCFAAGYPTGNGPAVSPRGGDTALTAAAAADSETRALSDRTRPEWLAKLASAPASPPAQDPPAGLESAALADRIEAAASTTGSLPSAKKPPRVVPLTAQSGKSGHAQPHREAATPLAEKPAARRPPAPARKTAASQRAASSAPTTLAGFFRRAGLSRAVAPPDPAR